MHLDKRMHLPFGIAEDLSTRPVVDIVAYLPNETSSE